MSPLKKSRQHGIWRARVRVPHSARDRLGPGAGLGDAFAGCCAAALLCLVALASVCRAQQVDPAAWPARFAVCGERGVIREIEGPFGDWAVLRIASSGLRPTRQDLADADALLQHCGDEPPAIRFENDGGMFVRFRPQPDGAAPVEGAPVSAFVFVSASLADDPEPTLDLQRTWFAFYEPANPGDAPRGVVLIAPGMFGTPENVVEAMVQTLRHAGWHVLRMLTQPSRFTESVVFTIDPESAPEPVARQAARILGDRAAECAFAVQAAFAHVERNDPRLANLPRAALGMSGGAMAMPTILALEPERYGACVLIAGGADFWAIAALSNYADWIDAVRVEWTGGPPPRSAIDRFAEAYRAAAPLDNVNTAPAVRSIPTLMIHGTRDRAVPSDLGDLLWERLGRPERWSAPMGHEMLFFVYLPRRSADLIAWLDRTAGGRP